MKHTRQLFSALLCLVLVFTSSSLVVNAAEVDTGKYHAYVELLFDNTQIGAVGVYPFDGTVQNKSIEEQIQHNYKPIPFWLRVSYATDDTTSLFVGGKETTVRLENIYLNAKYQDDSGYNAKLAFNVTQSVLIFYANGEMEYLYVQDEVTATQRNDYTDLTFTFTPDYDVTKIEAILEYTASVTVSRQGGVVTATIGESTDDDFQLSADQDDGTKGLIASIIQWVHDIWNAIEDGFDSVLLWMHDIWNAIEDGFDSVLLWMHDIWNAIEDGFDSVLLWIQDLGTMIFDKFTDLLNVINHLWDDLWTLGNSIVEWIGEKLIELFVPDREELLVLLEDCMDVYLDKFGFLGETAQMIGTFIADCLHSDRIDSITIPEVSIDLPENESFSFGGQTVKVVPDGFEELATLCKSIVGVMCTLLFINGMRKRYDELMGVET